MESFKTVIKNTDEPKIIPTRYLSYPGEGFYAVDILEYSEPDCYEPPLPLFNKTQALHVQTTQMIQHGPLLSSVPKELIGVLISNEGHNSGSGCYDFKTQKCKPSHKEIIQNFYKKYCSCDPSQSLPPASGLERNKMMTPSNIMLVRKLQKDFPNVLQRTRRLLIQHLSGLESDEEFVFVTRIKTKKAHIRDNFRGSKYIGVSKNGESWQVYIIIDRSK